MATTKIWPVHDSLKRLVEYAGNPEKTEFKDLSDAINYAGNESKTEKFFFSWLSKLLSRGNNP